MPSASSRLIRLIFALLISTSVSSIAGGEAGKNPDELKPPRLAMFSITADEAQRHVDILASDKFEGRKSGTHGQKLAARYLADALSSYGLLPVGDDGYFQNFDIVKSDLKEGVLELQRETEGAATTTFSLKSDFIPFSFSGENRLSAPIVFAGYGISAPEYGYDDYENLDVKGKIVLVLRHEPQENDVESVFDGLSLTKHAYFRQKAENAFAHGAVGMLLVTDPLGEHDNSIPEVYWPSLYPGRMNARPWALGLDDSLAGFLAIWVSMDVAETILTPLGRQLDALQKAIDETLRPQSFEVRELKTNLKVDLEKEVSETQNVLALLEGSDPTLKDEVIVVGAHYDHLGKLRWRVFNGADDNASGTAGMLEIAQAFSQSETKPARSVLFIAFAAEEMGLLGSQYYVEHPVFDLSKTIFMLNLDMIGRNAPNEVTVVGSNRSPEVHEVNLEANQEIGMEFKYNGEKYFSRSDHANFALHKIPFLFYNTEVHEDYHRTSDTADQINSQKLARIARLGFLVSWKMANRPDRPTYKPFRLLP